MTKLSIVVLCALCLGSCSEGRDFAYHERAEFNNMKIGEIEDFVRETAERWGLIVYEVPKQSLMRGNYEGSRGLFSMGVGVEGSSGPVFWISNSAAAHVITLMMAHEMGLPSACVDRLHEELKSGLEKKFDIKLQPVPTPAKTHDAE